MESNKTLNSWFIQTLSFLTHWKIWLAFERWRHSRNQLLASSRLLIRMSGSMLALSHLKETERDSGQHQSEQLHLPRPGSPK
jgi:hypothetical protein